MLPEFCFTGQHWWKVKCVLQTGSHFKGVPNKKPFCSMDLETKGERMDKVGIRKMQVKVENVFLIPPSICKEISADVSERALGARL